VKVAMGGDDRIAVLALDGQRYGRRAVACG
jgi:hypothetical protein